MEAILIVLISALLSAGLTYINNILNSIVPIALHAEQYMTALTGQSGFQETFDLLTNFGISLIILKFLKKGFDMYVAWSADPDNEPLDLLTNFIKAMVVALSFPVLYGWLATVISDLTDELLITLSGSLDDSFAQKLMAMCSLNLFNAILCLVFFICFFLLYIQFLMRGFEILILRLGMPIACVGLIDSNKGVFAGYLNKFFQSTLSVMVQIALCKMSLGLMINGHIFWGIAGIILALKTPKFLQEVVVTGGGGVSMNTVYHTSQMVKMVQGVFKK
jgi:hypothetical protein